MVSFMKNSDTHVHKFILGCKLGCMLNKLACVVSFFRDLFKSFEKKEVNSGKKAKKNES